MQILREQGLTDKVNAATFYVTPGAYKGVKEGSIMAFVTDYNAPQSRRAIDMLVRIHEDKNPVLNVQPGLETIVTEHVAEWDPASTLAPDGWKFIFTVN